MNNKVFAVIVTYNGARWIDKNITSLLASSHPVSIIAVDNNSTDNSVALLQKYPEVDLIRSAENLGFGKANNIGMQKALNDGAEYVFLLNQDAWVFKDTIAGLLSKTKTNPGLGIVSPMHYDGTGNALDAGFATYYGRATHKSHNRVAIVPFVNAAAWMLGRECIEKVGLFEPLYKHYGEDRNYCDRVAYHSFRIGIDEDSKICHDRIIRRNFDKDMVQGKYKILSALLNINNSLLQSYSNGLREVFGLPKYFMKFYGMGKSVGLFFTLLSYYLRMMLNVSAIKAARNNAK